MKLLGVIFMPVFMPLPFYTHINTHQSQKAYAPNMESWYKLLDFPLIKHFIHAYRMRGLVCIFRQNTTPLSCQMGILKRDFPQKTPAADQHHQSSLNQQTSSLTHEIRVQKQSFPFTSRTFPLIPSTGPCPPALSSSPTLITPTR